MNSEQRALYFGKLWPEACAVQGWKKSDEGQRKRIVFAATGETSSSALDEDQITLLFIKLRWLADPANFDKALADSDPAAALAENKRKQLIWRIEKAAVAAELGHDPAKVDVIRMELPCHSADCDGRHASEAYRAAVYARDFTAPAKIEAEPETLPEIEAPAPTPDAVTVTENDDKNGVEIRFPAKPQAFLLESLKALGWRWSRVGACWYHRRSDEALAFARNLAATFTHA